MKNIILDGIEYTPVINFDDSHELDILLNQDIKDIEAEELGDVPQMISEKMIAQQQLINLLYSQIVDLTTMSKIELSDDVTEEIKRLQGKINLSA